MRGVYFIMDYLQNAPKPGEFYRHFKGNLYQILAVAIHTETEEPLVIYQALYGDFQIFARPLAMFQDIAENGKKRFVKTVIGKNIEDEHKDSPKSQSEEDYRGKNRKQTDEITREINKNQSKNQNQDKNRNQNKNQDKNQNQNKNQDKDLYEQMEKFYDADSYEEKLSCLLPLRGKLNDIMLMNIAVSLDIAVPEGSIEDQFQSIISCLKTMKKYQRSRLR